MKIKSMILLLVALCFVLASCSGKKEADSNKDTQQNQQQKHSGALSPLSRVSAQVFHKLLPIVHLA